MKYEINEINTNAVESNYIIEKENHDDLLRQSNFINHNFKLNSRIGQEWQVENVTGWRLQ